MLSLVQGEWKRWRKSVRENDYFLDVNLSLITAWRTQDVAAQKAETLTG